MENLPAKRQNETVRGSRLPRQTELFLSTCYTSSQAYKALKLPAKLLDYFLQSNKSNINQSVGRSAMQPLVDHASNWDTTALCLRHAMPLVVDESLGQPVMQSVTAQWLGKPMGEEKDPHQCTRTACNRLVAVVWTVGKRFLQGHQVFCFCDNTSAMSAVVHGYARSPDIADLSNTVHLALAALKFTPFFEWVPSLANCADTGIPSHPQGLTEEDSIRKFYKQVRAKHWLER